MFPIDRRAGKGAIVLLIAGILSFLYIKLLAVLIFCVLGFHLAFFRDPVRTIPVGDYPVSPADGKVVEISPVEEPQFLKGKAVKIGIFLSIFNAHVNRAPEAGRIAYLQYKPGKFLNVLDKKSVNLNESNWIGIEGARRVLVRQISGAIARRIFWDVRLEDQVRRGDKVGIICYGSRTECFLPAENFQVAVKLGDLVKAGETVLGVWTS